MRDRRRGFHGKSQNKTKKKGNGGEGVGLCKELTVEKRAQYD